MFSAEIVSNEFILRAQEDKIILSPMKLQKLLFFLYGRHLADTGEKLFNEPFAVWKYGPVVESVYYEFKCFGSDNITDFARDARGDAYFPSRNSGTNERFFISFNKTWERYKNCMANYLVFLTHQQGTPWYRADRENKSHIPNEYISQYFGENKNV